MEHNIITEEMIRDLPDPVYRYMQYTGVVGQAWVDNVWLSQVGKFRQDRDKAWMPMTAEQRYTTSPAGFVWQAKFKLAGLPLMRATDRYEAGKGHMQGKLAGIINLFDVQGEKLDQGAMLRYLSEMIWFPTAFLGPNIHWESRDADSAQVTFTDHGKSVQGVMYFDGDGRFTNFKSQRYREIAGDFSLDPWSTPMTEYGRMAGLNLPLKGQAVWNLPTGDLPYIDLAITEIKYNQNA